MRLIAIFLLLLAVMCLLGFVIGVSHGKSHVQYLNEQYLKSVKKAQKANLKNKAEAEFWYNESERYKALIEKSTTKEI